MTASVAVTRPYQFGRLSTRGTLATFEMHSYKLGLQFKHLYLVTAFWPQFNTQYALAHNIHVPI